MSVSTPLLDPGRAALLVIDMQNDFVSPGGYHSRRGKACGPMLAIFPSIQYLLQNLPPALRRIFVITAREPDGSDNHWRLHHLLPGKLEPQVQAPAGDLNCVRGTWGAEFVEGLQPGPGDHVLVKRRYSAFYQTDLELLLRSWGIQTLLFAGVATEVCVETTLREAFLRDFDVLLVSDCVATWDEERHLATCRVVEQCFGWVRTSQEVVRIFTGR